MHAQMHKCIHTYQCTFPYMYMCIHRCISGYIHTCLDRQADRHLHTYIVCEFLGFSY